MNRLAYFVMATVLLACSSDDSPAKGGSDAGADTGSTVNNSKCTAFDDKTEQTSVKITFPSDGDPAQYSPNCVKIKKGVTVAFEGAFQYHPLTKPEGETSSNPIVRTSSGTSKNFTFNGLGIFAFQCDFHPTIMYGGIQVVEK